MASNACFVEDHRLTGWSAGLQGTGQAQVRLMLLQAHLWHHFERSVLSALADACQRLVCNDLWFEATQCAGHTAACEILWFCSARSASILELPSSLTLHLGIWARRGPSAASSSSCSCPVGAPARHGCKPAAKPVAASCSCSNVGSACLPAHHCSCSLFSHLTWENARRSLQLSSHWQRLPPCTAQQLYIFEST